MLTLGMETLFCPYYLAVKTCFHLNALESLIADHTYFYSVSSEEQHIIMIKGKVENIKDKIDGNELDLSLSNLTEVPVKELVSSLTFPLS